MKKGIVVAGSLLILFLAGTFLFIPANLFVSRSVTSRASYKGITRFIQIDSNWSKWQLKSFEAPGKTFITDGYSFTKTNTLFSSVEFAIQKDGFKWDATLHILPDGNDSVQLMWKANIKTGNNPFRKIQSYTRTRELGEQLDKVLSSLKSYVSMARNLYAIDIKEEKVKIEYLVSSRKRFDHYPKTADIYGLIGQIRTYVAQKNAKEEDFPMLHFWNTKEKTVSVQVAIPVNMKLPETDQFLSKRMLKNGNILMAEVTGGPFAVDAAMKQVEQYLSDYQYSNVAIPFQSLVTDRSKEPDSSKWVTRVYYPIR